MPDLLSVELEILDDKATVKVDRFTQSLHSLNSDINNVGRNSPFAEKLTTDFVALEKKSNDVRKAFQNIQTTRLDSGNIGHLTREIVKTSERARQLQSDITGIRRELANPNRKSSIAFLTEELKAAEREADSLNRKLDRVNTKDSASQTTSGGRRSSSRGGRRGGHSEGLLTGLELVDDFAPAGLNRPFNAAVKGLVSATAISGTALISLGAVAAAGIGIVKITQNIREEAEKRLKIENAITGAINKQILSQKQAFKDYKELRENSTFDRQFNRDLQTGQTDELKSRRATAEKLLSLTPAVAGGKPNENFQRLQSQIIAIDAQLETIQQRNTQSANDSFNQRFENFRKSQENAIASERKRSEEIEKAEKKRNEEIEKGKKKVEELSKVYSDTFNNLFQKSGAGNPFVSLFSEADKSISEMRKNLAGLSPELQAVAEKLQQKLNADSAFNTRLDNDFASFDLKERANELRSFKQQQIEDPNKFFNDFTEAGLKQIAATNGGGQRFNSNIFTDGVNADRTPKQFTNGFSQSNANPNTRYNSNIFADRKNPDGTDKLFTNGFSQSDARNDLFYSYDKVSSEDGSFGGFSRRNKSFDDLTTREKDDFINRDNLGLQDKLSRTFSLAGNRNALNDEQQGTVDRKILALSSSVRPDQLNESQRNIVAEAAEKEALRKDNYERKAESQRAELIAAQNKVADELIKLRQIAEKEGLKGIENVIRFIDDTTGGITPELQSAATAKDTQKAYDDAYKGGTFYEDSKK